MAMNNSLSFFGLSSLLPKSGASLSDLVDGSGSTDFAGTLKDTLTSAADATKAAISGDDSSSDSGDELPFDIKVGYVDMALMATPLGQANFMRSVIQEQMVDKFADIGKDMASAMVMGMAGEMGVATAVVASIADAAQSSDETEAATSTTTDTQEASADVASTPTEAATAMAEGGIFSAIGDFFDGLIPDFDLASGSSDATATSTDSEQTS
jgi:hypothetical protein